MWLDLQGIRQASQGANGRIAGATFEVADVTALHLGFETELLLGHASQLPVFPDIETQENDRIHLAMWSKAEASVCIPIVSFVLSIQFEGAFSFLGRGAENAEVRKLLLLFAHHAVVTRARDANTLRYLWIEAGYDHGD